jgi:hypothetical protein
MSTSVNRRIVCVGLGGIALSSVVAPFAFSQDPAKSDRDDAGEKEEAELTKTLQDECRKQLESYEFSDGSQKLDRKFVSVLTWTNPARDGVQRGVVGVWTLDGRPFAIGTVFCHPLENKPGIFRFNHELHMLREKGFAAETTKGEVWKAPTGGFMLTAIKGAEPPAESPIARLRQMRSLADRFTASAISDMAQKSQLRLLPKPLYRYETKNADGALFTFMADAGTDPEVILAIECDKVGKTGQWYFGCARYSDMKLFVKLDGNDAWAFEDGAKGPWHKSGVNDPLRFYTAVEVPLASLKPQ